MSNANSKHLTRKEKVLVEGFTTEIVNQIMTPMNDFVFKKLFGTVGNEKLVKDFLEAILEIEIEIHFIEMPKFLNSERKEQRRIDQWLLFLKFPDEEMMKEIMENNENIKDAKEELDKIKQDEHMQYLAWLREKYILETNSMKSEGLEIGREQGYEEGRAEGHAEGRMEGVNKTKKEIARKLKKQGMTVEEISKLVDLPKE